jgi:hypothetical protein
VAAKADEAATEESVSSEEENAVQREPQLPGLVLAIEEPELYQHPSRQRHMASVLLELSQGTIPGVAKRTQVLYSTHSPLFVGLDRFEQIRLLRKVGGMAENPWLDLVSSQECSVFPVSMVENPKEPEARLPRTNRRDGVISGIEIRNSDADGISPRNGAARGN